MKEMVKIKLNVNYRTIRKFSVVANNLKVISIPVDTEIYFVKKPHGYDLMVFGHVCVFSNAEAKNLLVEGNIEEVKPIECCIHSHSRLAEVD